MNAKHSKGKHYTSDETLDWLLGRAVGFFKNYWRVMVLVLAVAVIALTAYHNYAGRKRSEFEQKWTTLSQLPDINPAMPEEQRMEALRGIVEESQELLATSWETRATPWVLLKLGTAQMDLGETDAAVSAFGRIVRNFPDHHASSLAMPNLAAAYEQQGEHLKAAEIYGKVAQDNPETASWLIAAARNMERAGDREGAIDAYTKAAELTADAEGETDNYHLARFRARTLQRDGAPAPPPPRRPEPVEAPDVDDPETIELGPDELGIEPEIIPAPEEEPDGPPQPQPEPEPDEQNDAPESDQMEENGAQDGPNGTPEPDEETETP